MQGLGSGYALIWLWPKVESAVPGVLSWITDKLLAPALVAVFFTALTNVVLERLKAGRDQATKVCDALKGDIAVLQVLSGEYWARKSKAGDDIVEARIIALQTEIIDAITMLREDFGIVTSSDAENADIIDALTGGDFGGVKRAADASRLQTTSTLLSALKIRVTRQRWARMKRTGW